ncbi:beta strand repeat-containing protein [Algoriphagus confluentis]|uniref:beta strand repeat-containing protein n=1 Tax=Algoriphagus confluentis TaxID=1697556 RepID=UPI0030C6C03A
MTSLFILFMGCLGVGEVRGQCTETVTLTSTGAGTWVVPANVTSITVEVWGAGGAGGRANGNPSAGGGGSGGGYVRRTFTGLSGSINFFIGQGGNGGSGGNGQSSWFQNNTTLLAVGGNGAGTINTNNTWGSGAAAITTGNIGGTLASHYGGAGGNASNSESGGGGASAGTSGNGNSGSGINGGTSSNGSTAGANGRNTNNVIGTAGNDPGSGGSGGRANSGTDRNGGNGGDGQIRITYTYEFCAEFVSVDYGSSTWCPGEDRNISVTIRNGGTAPWTNASPDINIGVRWNPNGVNWNDFHVRTDANNLAPGDTRTYNFTLRASNNAGGGYTTPLAAGVNNLRFDVVNEANFWFRNRPGNAEYITPNITISQAPSTLSYTNNNPTYCANQAITANNATVTGGSATSFTVSPALPAGLSLNPSTGQITGTPTTVAGVPTAAYTVTATNSCGSVARVLNITITPAAPTGLNYTNNTVTYCAGSPITPNNPSFGGGGPATTFSVSPALPAGLSLNTTTGQITGTPTTLTGLAAANYTVTASNSCGNITRNVNITISQVAEVNNFSDFLCSGVPFTITPLNVVNGRIPTGTTYTWTAPSVSGGVTGGASGSGSSITGTLVNPTNVAQPVVYTVTPITNGCAGSPFQLNILLNPSASITTINQQVCSESSFAVTPTNGTNGVVPAGTTYTWNAPTVTGGITGGIPGGGNTISGTLTNPTNLPQTATYTVTPVTGSCVGAPFNVVITVNPRPAITAMSETSCSNQPFSALPVNGTNGIVPAGTTYAWTSPSLPAGLSGGSAGSGSSITGTLINSTNAPLNATYTVTPTAGACTGNTFTLTVTVNPSPVIPTQTPTICSGEAFTVSPTNGGATIVPANTTYTWTVVDNPNVTGESAQATAQSTISQTLTNTSTVTQTVTYTVTPRSGTAGSCVGNPFTVTVTVNPRPTLSSPLNQTRCSNVSSSYIASSATPGTSFSWTRAAVAGISNPAASGSGATSTETLVNTTPNAIDVVYVYTLTANGCTNTQNVTVTVSPTPVLSSSLTPAAICSNGLFSYSPTSSTSGASFTWTRSAVAGISNPAITTPQTNNPNEVLVNTTANPIDVVYAFTISANGCSNTQNVTVRVNPTPALSSTLSPNAICSNSAFTYTPTSLTPGATFTWTRAAVSGISNPAVTTPQASNPNEVLINTTTSPVDVIYAYSVTANGCTNTQNVTVRVNPTPTLSSPLSPTAICSNALFTYNPSSSVSGATFTWTRAAVTGISNAAVTVPQASNPNETLINTTANPIDVVYAYTVTANGCSNTQNVTVRVNPTPTLSTSLSPPAICSNSVFSYTPASTTAGTNITWTRAAISGISNPAVTTPQPSSPNETLINTTASPIDVVYNFTLTANGCNNTQSVTVRVNPSPVLSSTTSLEICSNDNLIYTATSATSGTVFSWTRALVSGISNAASSGTGDTVNETLINTTANPIDVVYVFTLGANGCITTQNVTVTVKPSPTLSSATSIQVCDGGEFTYTATSDTPGVSFLWTRALVSGISNPAGTGSTASITETLVNTTASPIDVIYEFTLSVDGCSNTQSLTVTVNPTPTLSSPLTSPAICGNETFTYSPSSLTSGAVFTWTRAAVPGISNPAITTPQSTNPNEVLVNTTPDPINVIYQYSITANSCTHIQEVMVTVNPTPDISTLSEEVCSGGTFTVSPVQGVDGIVPTGTTYTWTVANNPNVTGESNEGTPQATISQTLTNTGSSPQNVVYTVTPISGGCVGDPFTLTVTINGDTQIDTQPSVDPFEVCFGDTFSPISVVASGASGLTYQWFSNSTASSVGGTAVPGATSASFTPPSSTQGEFYYYVVVTGPCTTVTSDVSGRYFVSPPVTAIVSDLDTSPQTICPGDSFSALTFQASGANLSYQWYRNSSASTSGGTLITGEISSSFTPPTSDFGPVYYYALATSDCGTVTSSVSGAFAITGSSSTAANQTLCVDTPLNPVITHTTTGTTGIANHGVAGANGLPPGVSATWSSGIITISGTPTSSAGSPYTYSIPLIGACGSEVATGTITVNPKAQINNLNQTICTGGTFSVTPAQGIDGTIPSGTTYTWTAPTLSAGLTGGVAGSGSSITGSLVNSTNTPRTATYTVTPTSGSCLGNPFTITITVNPSASIPAQTATICDGETFTVSPVHGGATRVPIGTTYTWTVVDNPNVNGESNQTTAQPTISQALSNSSNLPQNVVYTVTPTSGTCVGNPFTVTVTVNPNPEIPNQTTAVCSGSAFTVSPTNGGTTVVPAGTSYTWTVADNPNVTGETNQSTGQPTISQTLINLTQIPQPVIYTVTPRSGAAGNCLGNPFTVTVTVNPSPQILAQAQTICSGNAFTISPTNGGGNVVPSGTVYTWTVVDNPNVSGETTQTTAQTNISQTLTNTSTTPQNVVYTVTPQSGATGSCAGNPFTVTITVNPNPTLSSTLSPPDICSNSAFTYTPTSTISGATFSWTRAAVAGISNPAISNPQTANPNEVLINTTSNPIDVVYTYSITANGCSNSQQVTVRVKPTPTLSSPINPTAICGNLTFSYTPTSTVLGTTFTWTRAAVAGISNPAVTTPQSSNPNETLINTTSSPINVIYAFTLTANGCTNTQNVTVRVDPRPTLSSSLTPSAICSGSSFTYIPSSAGGTATFTWTRAAVPGISNSAVTTPQASNPNEVLNNTTPNPIEVTYVYTINENGCTHTQNVRVTVNPTPQLSSTLAPAEICTGSPFTYTATSATAGTSITWTRAAVAGISNPAITTPQNANPNEILINTTTIPQNVVYRFTLSSNGCSNTQDVTVRVNPSPTLSSSLTPAAVCSNAAFTYTPTSTTPGASFSWTRAAVTGISNTAGSGTGNINETLINTTSSPVNVVYSLTTSANGCSTTANVTVRIDPVPSITNQFPGNPFDIRYDICSGQSFSFTPQDGVDGLIPAGTTYTWVFTNENGNLSGSSNGSGTTISGTIFNSDIRRRNVDYVVTPIYNGCTGAPFTIRVRVQPEPNVSPVSSPAAVCNGTAVGPFNFTGSPVLLPNGNPTTTEYNWTNSNPSIGLAASGTGNIPSFTTINNGVAPALATITVTPRANGCDGPSQTFTITVNPSPKVTVAPDYCVVGGRVQLIANSNVPGSTFLWNTGQTTSNILVDLSGQYFVTVTAPNGCSTTESIGVAQELVTDGSFTNFNPASPSFFTEYTQNQAFYTGVNTSGLWPETRYAVNTSAHSPTNGVGYHPNFHGRDRTNNATGPRNFLMVNGATTTIGTPPRQRIIWQQTVTVEPNTDYYFSAWAMNLNPSNPARLQFEVNGVLVGTIADLNTAPKPTSDAQVNLNNWVRFYSDPTWNSGTATTAVIRIRNLNTVAGGNDFGLDDISFGTLKPFIVLTSGAGSDNQTICQNSPLGPLSYNAGSGIFGPEVTGLPNGITAIWNGIDLQFIGSPTESGVFNYTITTVGTCVPTTATGTITVRATPTTGAIAANQTVCSGQDPMILSSVTNGTGESGATISYRWESNTNLTTPNWTVVPGQTGATYDPPVLPTTTQYRRTTLATLGGLTCESPPTPPVTITVQTIPTAGSIATNQTICNGGDPLAFTSTVAGSGSGTITYRWESSVSPFASWTPVSGASLATYDAPSGLTATTRFRRIAISTLNGVACESVPTAPVEVTVSTVPTPGSIASNQAICEGEDPTAFTSPDNGTGSGSLFYVWESSVSPFTTWTEISGANLATYDAPPLFVTTRFRRRTVSTFNGVVCESVPTSPVEVTILPNINVAPVNPDPPLCLDVPQPVTIIHSSTGANGIANAGIAGANGLPLGVSAAFNSSTGEITISGTPTEVGSFNYSIPVTGVCGTINATGTITVDNPTYPIISIDVVNPASGSTPPYTSTFTVYSNELTPGNYEINYSLSGANAAPNQTILVTVTTTGQFTFQSLPYSNEGTTLLTINSIREISALCPYSPPNNNTVPYGINCSTEYLAGDGNATYSVAAGVSQVTIQAFGDGTGGNTATQSVSVIPGELIFVVFNGTDVFATQVPDTEPLADRLAQAIVSTTGPNGRLVFTYDCPDPSPCSGTGDVYQYTDSEGYTVIRVTGDCSSWTWNAPDGLDEFEVLVVGGGGGGGFGDAAGGGGGGAVIYQHFTGITMNGAPGLQGAVFQVLPGGQGFGATSANQQGGDGTGSTFTGPVFAYAGGNSFNDLAAAGGGGGGSSSANSVDRVGSDGASGGGGAAFGTNASSGGVASNGNNGGVAMGQSYGGSGAGGGGAALGGNNGSGNASLMSAGSGGNGVMQSISGENIYYGAGGGGTSYGATVNEPGMGGSPYTNSGGTTFYAGGRGNNTGIGLPATTYGSGGGAGRTGGSNGFQGVVYIRYPNFRILPLEYLYFNAEYNSSMRSGDLTWATANEWENDRFEIERSVNDVKSWETISQVNGAGYSDSPTDYSYQDFKLPLAGGNIFYRLKQFDFDGDFTYSDIKAIQVESLPGLTRWKVYPNPTTGDPINLEMLDNGAYNDEEITVRLISATGQFDILKGESPRELSLRLADILQLKAAGVYTLEISWGANREYHKVILRR